MPHRRTEEEVALLVGRDVTWRPEYLDLPAQDRIDAAWLAREFYEPVPQTFLLESMLSTAIRAGYVARNPLSGSYKSDWVARLSELKEKSATLKMENPRAYDNYDDLRPDNDFDKLTNSITEIGPSGVGKSRTTLRILKRLYPQVIFHSEYHEQKISFTQVVWLLVETPRDGSAKGMLINAFRELDRVTGQNYYENCTHRGRATVNEMIAALANLTWVHAIGIIGFDELQNLRVARGNEAELCLNLLAELENLMGIPLLKVGTPQAQKSLRASFRHLRRSTNYLPWERMRNTKDDWHEFFKALWAYQYVTNYQPELNPDLRNVLYDISQGIADVAVNVFFLAQIEAIRNGSESIAEDIMGHVADSNLQPLQYWLNALRNNQESVLEEMPDIRIDWDGEYSKLINSRARIRGVTLRYGSANALLAASNTSEGDAGSTAQNAAENPADQSTASSPGTEADAGEPPSQADAAVAPSPDDGSNTGRATSGRAQPGVAKPTASSRGQKQGSAKATDPTGVQEVSIAGRHWLFSSFDEKAVR
jgi:hypothetical protein